MGQETQQWDARQYAANGRFVADLAGEIVSWLSTGARRTHSGLGLRRRRAYIVAQRAAGAIVIGVELDSSMAAAARTRGRARLRAVHDQSGVFSGEFDAVFSNAALHWVRDQAARLLRGVHAALIPGGRFVAEMGGLGNIAAIRVALSAVCRTHGVDAETIAASFVSFCRRLHRAAASRPAFVWSGWSLCRVQRSSRLAWHSGSAHFAVLSCAALPPPVQDSVSSTMSFTCYSRCCRTATARMVGRLRAAALLSHKKASQPALRGSVRPTPTKALVRNH